MAFYDVIEQPRPPALGSPEAKDVEADGAANHQGGRHPCPIKGQAGASFVPLATLAKINKRAATGSTANRGRTRGWFTSRTSTTSFDVPDSRLA